LNQKIAAAAAAVRMTASSNTMKYKEELYNLDPLHRMDNVPLFKDDGLVSNAKKYFILNLSSSSSSSSDLYGIFNKCIFLSRIYKELKDDIFLIRLRDIVWREFSKQK
jgi:hypothetical protein